MTEVQSAGLRTFLQEIAIRSCRLNFAASPAQPVAAAASATGGATAGAHAAEDQGQRTTEEVTGSPLKRAGEDDFLQGFSSAAD